MITPRDLTDPGEVVTEDGKHSNGDGRPAAAAIDIGSNSIKMTIGRADDAGRVEQIDWASEVVRLGEGLDETGRLEEERIDLAVETLARFAERARELGASTVVAVATEATRAAANGGEFLDRVHRETGIAVRVLDGLEEAALTFRGLAPTTDLAGATLIADVGGGSTELIVARDGVMQSAQSIPLGSGRLTARCIQDDPPRAAELETSEAVAAAALRSAMKVEPLPEQGRLIVVGGTGEFLTRLVPDAEAIDLPAVRAALAKMTVLTAAELADAIDAPEARARVLPAGVAIVAALAAMVRPARIEVSRSGVRAGLLREVFERSGSPVNNDRELSASLSSSKAPSAKSGAIIDRRSSLDVGFREAMKALIAARWQAVWDAIPAALEGADIEGVHDVRVASRRLRAAMDTAAPVFPQRWYRQLHKVAKSITSALGEVRDRDVLLEAMQRDRRNAPLAERPGIDRLIERVERERIAARAEMERFLNDLLSGPEAGEIDRRFGSLITARKRPGDDSRSEK
jgi:hypothetical protein